MATVPFRKCVYRSTGVACRLAVFLHSRRSEWYHDGNGGCAVTIHTYGTVVHWTATDGEGTASYRSYSRDHAIGAGDKPEIAASSDPAFRGNASRYNPEELLVASLSSCHMLWYLHLCSVNGVTVVDYRDDASGSMEEKDGTAQFVSVELRPVVTVAAGDRAKALALHDEAHRLCFIARSVNFLVTVRPQIA